MTQVDGEQVDYRAVWMDALQALDEQGVPVRQRAFLQLSRLVGVLQNLAIITAPNPMTKQVIEEQIGDDVRLALSDRLGLEGVQLSVSVDPSLESDLPPPVESLPQTLETRSTLSTRSTQPSDRATSPPLPQSSPSQQPYSSLNGGAHPLPSDLSPGRAADTAPAVNGAPYHRLGEFLGEANAIERRTALGDGLTPPTVPGMSVIPAMSGIADKTDRSRLNHKYTFETFVPGASNRFAHAAAVAVAEAPAKAYNPLFIYGDSGLGKTHLLHAIGLYARTLLPHLRVRYVNSEEFTNDFINSIRDDRTSRFQSIYRDVDVLLIDDIQFLTGKVQTQEEFFHTFNALHNASHQVVITSDLPPKQLQNFEERLRSRFEWGLITDVQPPDLETRIAILRKKAILERMSAPDDVLEYIASKISSNIRELEGALIRVTAFASLNKQPVTLDLAEIVLRDLIPSDQPSQINAPTIMAQTAAYYGFTIEDLCSNSRSRQLVTARQIAMYLCRELTEMSLPKIGQQFGGRDHTTVMHADRKIRELMSERRAIYNQVTELTNRIKQQSR